MSTEHPFRRLLRYGESHRSTVRRAAAFSFLNKVFDLAPPALIGAAVDIVVRREDSLLAGLGIVDVRAQLWWLLLGTLVIWGLESLFEWLSARTWRELAQQMQHELRVDAYTHMQGLELAYFHRESAGGLMSILNDDINQLERFLDSGADTLVQLTTTTIVVSAIFFYLAPSVAWLAMAPIPVILWGSITYQRKLGERYARVRERVADVNSLLSNNLRGIATIKSFDTEAREIDRVTAVSEAYRAANERAIFLSSAFSPLIRAAIVVGFGATLVWGGFMALDGRLEVGVYSVLVFMTQRLLWPLTRLGQTLDLYQRAAASTTRIMNLLDTEPQIIEGERDLPRPIRGEVEFRDVDFGYLENQAVLKGFNLTIPAGSTVGIVGSTGAGKTTITNLILRFFDPTAGTVLLDGVDVQDLKFSEVRAASALVSQQSYLFAGTLRDNVVYGVGHPTDEALASAARVAELDEFVDSLPDGWDTVVGERGMTLSGGQRQRVSIARAILADAPILILDEATSAVDNETEAAIQRSLERVARTRTTIVIAHRLSTVRNADTIIVLHQGTIVEQGTHDELAALNGIYANLWAIQTGSAA